MLSKIGSTVIIRRGKIPGIIVGRNDNVKDEWEVEFENKKGAKVLAFYNRWQLRNSKPGDKNFKGTEALAEKPIQSSNKRSTRRNQKDSASASNNEGKDLEKSRDEEKSIVEFPLPDIESDTSSSMSSKASDDDSNDSFSVFEQCKQNTKKPFDDRRVPFGKHVLVVILKGNHPGIITKTKGPKTWEVEYKDSITGSIKKEIFKSKQMRRPKDETEYFMAPVNAIGNQKNTAAKSPTTIGTIDCSSASDIEDETEEEDVDPDEDGDEEIPQWYLPIEGEDEGGHSEGQPELNEYEMRFAGSLEPEGNRFDVQIKEYQAKLNELIDSNYSITKKVSSSKLGIGTHICERKTGGREGVITSGSKGMWEIKFVDGTIESNIKSQRLKRINDTSIGKKYVWRLVRESNPEPGKEVAEYNNVGLAGFDFKLFAEDSIKSKKDGYSFPFLKLLQTLWPGDWCRQLDRLNCYIETDYNRAKDSKRRMSSISRNKWWVFIGILIGAAPLGKGGNLNLFDHYERESHSFVERINLGHHKNGKGYMSLDRFKKVRSVFTRAFAHTEKQDSDDWFMVLDLLEGFNLNRRTKFASSATKTNDESMSAFVPRTTATGGLPTISFIKRKPEPLGTEFKTVCCALTGVMLHMELQRGKAMMPKQKYGEQFGATAACTLRLAESTQHGGTNTAERKEAAERFKRELILADAWFGSVKVVEQMKLLHVDKEGKPAGHEVIAALKANHSCFPKVEIEEAMEDFPSGSHLVFECKSPAQVDLVAIGYKYNARKVLCFVATKNAGSTRPGRPYVAKFPDEYGNVARRMVPRPQIISTYFDNSDKVDAHNHARQYQLALEKRWVTRCAWFRINTTFIGITLTDAWKCAKYQSNNPSLKKMTIKEFADRIAWDCTNNRYSHSKDALSEGNTFIEVDETIDGVVIPTAPPPRSLLLSQLVEEAGICIQVSDLASLAQSSISPLSSSQGSSRSSWGKHEPILNNTRTSDGRTARRRCKLCHKQTPWKCNHPVCQALCDGDGRLGSFYCNTTKRDGSPKCIEVHQSQINDAMANNK